MSFCVFVTLTCPHVSVFLPVSLCFSLCDYVCNPFHAWTSSQRCSDQRLTPTPVVLVPRSQKASRQKTPLCSFFKDTCPCHCSSFPLYRSLSILINRLNLPLDNCNSELWGKRLRTLQNSRQHAEPLSLVSSVHGSLSSPCSVHLLAAPPCLPHLPLLLNLPPTHQSSVSV